MSSTKRLNRGLAALLLSGVALLGVGRAAMGQTATAQSPTSQSTPSTGGDVWQERPHVRLGGNGFWVDVLLPDERAGHYRGPRFVHGGMVGQVTIDSPAGPRTFLRQASVRDEPEHFDANAMGLAEEFSDPVGYEEAVISERDPEPLFMKVGVGLLGRTVQTAYAFWRAYPVKLAGPWVVVRGEQDVTFTQAVRHPAGWGYLYTIRVVADVEQRKLRLERTLSNTGSRELRTRHYSHHFFGFGGVEGIGEGYELHLGWPAAVEPGSKLADSSTVEVNDGQTRVALTRAVPMGKSISSYFETAGVDARRVELRHQNGQRVVYRTDEQIDRVLIWGSARVICPETFANIVLQPGEQKRWGGEYTFSVQ